MDNKIYTPQQFAEMIGKSVITLQRWDKKEVLKAYRTPTNRRYYTHAQYEGYRKQEHPEGKRDDEA